MNYLDRWSNKDVWKPFAGFDEMERDFDRIVDRFMNPVLSRMDARRFNQHLPCDIEETDSRYRLCFDLPGLKKEDINIEIGKNSLSVTGERKKTTKEKNGSGERVERYHGKFHRSFSLPETIDPDCVEAVYENGVLSLELRKREVIPSRKIEILDQKNTAHSTKIKTKRAA